MDEEYNLWVAVIYQALWDATLGASQRIGSGRKRPYIIPKNGNNYFYEDDVKEGRQFITGQTGALRDICNVVGMDYQSTRDMLLARYHECQKIIPEKWRENLETYPHNTVHL